MENNGHSFWGILGAFAVGAAAGSLAALLLAPRSGTETRATLAAVPDAVKAAYINAKQAGLEALNEGLDEVQDAKPASKKSK